MTEETQKSPKRTNQTRFLSQAIQLEESVNPHIIKATMTMVSAVVLAFVVWAGFTNINEVARTPGEVVPKGYQQIVQHLEGGIVKDILVDEGEIVAKGDVLVVLDDSSLRGDLERAQAMDISFRLEAERLKAFLENRQPDFSGFKNVSAQTLDDQSNFFKGMLGARQKEGDVIRDQIREKEQNIASLQNDLETAHRNLGIAKNLYERRVELNKKGYTSDMQILEDQRNLNQLEGDITRISNDIKVAGTNLAEYTRRLDSLDAKHRDQIYERLANVNDEITQNTKIIQKLQSQIQRSSIRSPSNGFVKGLQVNTISSVVQPGQTLMEIVPLDKHLEVEVKISPKDIGYLEIGQLVNIKFSTFDFSRFGSVRGQLDHISATTFSGEKGERFYKGRISLEKDYVGADERNLILPGMTVMADVITGEKTILQYLLKPIHVSLRTAFSER